MSTDAANDGDLDREDQKENAHPNIVESTAAGESTVKDTWNSLSLMGKELEIHDASDVVELISDGEPECSSSSSSDCIVDHALAEPQPSAQGELETVSEADMYVKASVNLAADLSPADRFSYAQLVIVVLKLDFYENKPYNKEFCISTAETVIMRCNLPKNTQHTLRHMLTIPNDSLPVEMIADLMSQLRSCAYLKEHGMHVLFADMISTFIGSGCYDSRHRTLMRHVCALLAVAWHDVLLLEESVAHLLIEDNFEESEEAQAKRKQVEKRKKYKRYALIGATGAVGGVLLGLTGGLAAPLVASGAGMVVGAGAAAGIATTTGAAVIGTLFGVGGAGLTGYKMQKRVGAIEEFVVETLSDGQSLHCAVAVSGWIQDDHAEAFRWPWRHLRVSAEQYTIRYESQYLLQVGRAMDYFMSMAVSMAVQQTLMETALAGIMSAIAWPVALLSVANVLDNPWNVCINRAAEVGSHLANILLRRQHGQRPVTLLGFSLGARVIYHCLLEMSKRPQCYGIIQDVYLLGAPVTGSKNEWKAISQVVGGRIINAYCRRDWLLKFLYRTMSAQYSIAGVAPVKAGITNMLNYDVNGHLDYRHKLREVLEAVGVNVAPHSSKSMNFTNADPDKRLSQMRLSSLDGGGSTPSTDTPTHEHDTLVSFEPTTPSSQPRSPGSQPRSPSSRPVNSGIPLALEAIAEQPASDADRQTSESDKPVDDKIPVKDNPDMEHSMGDKGKVEVEKDA